MAIHIRGAREHNLQNVDVEFGAGLTAVTGVSGSGKTSLVFDTLYHEARRRFLEVFALGSSSLRLSPAKIETLTGLGPAIAVGQNLLNRNPRSTLATASGLHPFLRLFYTHFGERSCVRCNAGLVLYTEDEVIDRLVALGETRPLTIYTPLFREVPGSHRTLLKLLQDGFGPEAILLDGHPWQGGELNPDEPHSLAVQVAGFGKAVSANQAREAVRLAAALGGTSLNVHIASQTRPFSLAPVCMECGTWFGDLEPVHFNSPCPHCKGTGCHRCRETGMHPQAAMVRWNGLRLPDLLARSVKDVGVLIGKADLPASAARLLVEITRRLEALEKVGLGYISLDRPSPTLSRGEAQRVRLAVALTSRLEDMLHVLDEPTIGQHPADVNRLLPTFRELRGPVIYVEHDRLAAAEADQVVDLGPGAGRQGGRVLFTGTPAALWRTDSPTGQYFSLRARVHVPEMRSAPKMFFNVRGANLRNLQDIDVRVPLRRLTVISGVSGSGKSTLVEDVIVASLRKKQAIGCHAVEGPAIKPVLVDQSPIGRNPRSNPATYTKLSDVFRDLFADRTGLSPSHFSFNRPEGACPTCKGMGAVEVRMRYLPSTWIQCAECGGQRFSEEVLSAKISIGEQRLSIADFYQLSVSEVVPLMTVAGQLPPGHRQTAKRILEALVDIGLGYLPLGQPSPSLSGGEAQRVKLARYLGRRSLAKQLLVLDEPSTGLHPKDLAGLLVVLDRLVRAGATILIVEHNMDVIRAADWVVDLGPGAGPDGGRLLFAGPFSGLEAVDESVTARALREEAEIYPRSEPADGRGGLAANIAIRDARAHNLKGVDVDFPKGALTIVTGVSGSGKSSLVGDVLEAEARRRFLETLSLYERQALREGPEAPVGQITGLGVALTIGPERRLYERRATVGTATEIAHHLAVLMALLGVRRCPKCGSMMSRRGAPRPMWVCAECQATAPLPQARHFSPNTYAAACLKCHGVGTLQVPNPEKLIIHPEKPLCAGAMYSPGFFPKGYLCKPNNHGYYIVKAVGERYGFDPQATPWNQMTAEAQRAFLFGDPEPMRVTMRGHSGRAKTQDVIHPGFYGWIRDWDVGGTYTDTELCPDCQGARLRPEYLEVTLGNYNVHQLSELSLAVLDLVMRGISPPEEALSLVRTALQTVTRRLHFLQQVGLGYLHLNRVAATLSAGEAQRVKLAGLIGSGLTSLTILLDEPSRGMHPSEVEALIDVLADMRDEGNTVVVVEHDPMFFGAADHLVDMGPGAGVHGGQVVAQGLLAQVAEADTVTGYWLRGERKVAIQAARREPRNWMTIHGARANNLHGGEVKFPLRMLVGICGVSGSGKSTLLVDTLGRALAPLKHTTSVAREPLEPGAHQFIEGASARTVLIDQSKTGVRSPASFLGLDRPLRTLYAATGDAHGLGLDETHLRRSCSACKGRGAVRLDMQFLPDIRIPCETCRGTGHLPEAWDVKWRGVALPELYGLTIDEVYDLFVDEERLTKPLTAARSVGLGYLVLRQPGHALSGGEAQRLKIAKELSGKTSPETLYILDEPTVGQHLEDVARLTGVLNRLVDNGHSVFVIEHHPHILTACDWLVELGPGGGPAGGRVIAMGTPEKVGRGDTPIAPYLRQVLEADQ